MQMHACEEPISIYKARELRVARRAPGVTFLSGTGYIVKTDDSRPRADSPSGTVDCRWSLCKIRRRIITDERQRGAAAAPHDAPRRARTRVTRRRPGARRSPNRKGERRRRADYSETIRNPENRENIAQIRMPNLDTDSSIQRKTPQRRERGPESKDRTNWQSVSEGPAVQRG